MLALLLLQGHTQWQRARQAGAVESKGRARQGWWVVTSSPCFLVFSLTCAASWAERYVSRSSFCVSSAT